MAILASRASVLRASLLAILAAFAVELAAGLAYGSLALLTDSAHALLDAGVTAGLLLAARMAARPPDARHTYGHGKFESLGGLLGGVAMLLVAALFVLEAASRAQGPPAAPPGLAALWAGAFVLGVDAFRVALLRRSAARLGGATLRADLYHAAADMGSTGVAMAGVALASYGLVHGDVAAALVLGALLAALSARLAYSSALDLTDVISPAAVAAAREAAAGTPGVVGVGPVLMRRSGDAVFADVTVSLRGDESFEGAHGISAAVESRIRERVAGASVTVHFEPAWDGVPPDAKVAAAAAGAAGATGVHNVSSYTSGGRLYVSLHVMVDSGATLEEAHAVSDEVEARVLAALPGAEHVTVHLEPHAEVPRAPGAAAGAEAEVRRLAEAYPGVRRVGRVAALSFGGLVKIDIDCSLDGGMPIGEAHAATAGMERALRARFPDAVVTIHPEPA